MSLSLRPRPQSRDKHVDQEGIASVSRALGHPARVHIVRLLLENQSCIGCDIVDELGLAQSTVSEHLRILKAAGVITGEIERPRVCYSLNTVALAPLAGLLTTIIARGTETILDGQGCCTPANPRSKLSRKESR